MNSKRLRAKYEKIRSTYPSAFNPEPWLDYPDLIEEMLRIIEKYEKETSSNLKETRKIVIDRSRKRNE